MLKAIWVLSIFFIIAQFIYIFGVPLEERSLFWEILFAFFIFYFSVFRLIIYFSGFYDVHNFFKGDKSPSGKNFEPKPMLNPFNAQTMSAMLLFTFISFPFLFVLSFSSTVIFKHYFSEANKYLSQPFPNVFFQSITGIGFLINLWSFSRNFVNKVVYYFHP